MTRTNNFGDVIRRELSQDPDLSWAVDAARCHAEIAQQIHDIREEAGLTQKVLASLAGTQQSAIARLEDADYEGHSISMLLKIARALNRQLRVEFHPLVSPPSPSVESDAVDSTGSGSP